MNRDILLWKRTWEHAIIRYAVSVAVTLSVLIASHALINFVSTPLPYLLLFPAIAFSAWFCGSGPSALALILALSGLKYWFIAPTHSLRVSDARQSICLLAFFFASALVIAAGEVRRRHHEKLQRAQAQLEDRVRERTVELDLANRSLRDLSARLLQLQDDERRRFARELHDSVGQLLIGLGLNLSAVRSDIEQLKKTAKTLTDSEALVQEMSQEVRTMSYLLHPPLLDEAGLGSAIQCYVDGFAQRSKIKVDLDLPNGFGRLSNEAEIAIFRMVQECLTNIHRHSGSSTAKIRLRHPGSHVIVEVSDRGKGMSREKQAEIASKGAPGVGIRGMRERFHQLGGSVEFDSNENGTVITARLPIEEGLAVAEDSSVSDKSPTAAA